jgi:tRNA nucleotidyltransferase (CCA-adding enzyme)
MNDKLFDFLKKVYAEHGYRLFLVGGTSRDMLLGRHFSDYDFATDATPEEERIFLPRADYAFAKYGSIHLTVMGVGADVTTFREETGYSDYRHPSKIAFVKDPSLDYKRRDFTINAIYIDEKYQVLDFVSGQEDLKNKIIRFIGDPATRVKEDPLRIIRAERFVKTLGFSLDPATAEAMKIYRPLLHKLNPLKVIEEERKLKAR